MRAAAESRERAVTESNARADAKARAVAQARQRAADEARVAAAARRKWEGEDAEALAQHKRGEAEARRQQLRDQAATSALAAIETYTGPTTILAGGPLALGNSTTTGSVAGNIVTVTNGGLLVKNPTSTTYAGIISGSGSVSVNGPGNFTLTGRRLNSIHVCPRQIGVV